MGEAVRQMFTAIAQHYDVLNTVLSFGLHHYWRQQAVAVSSIPSGARLLDVCSGTADLALAFARYLGHDGQVIATDFCMAMAFSRESDSTAGIFFASTNIWSG